MRIFEILIKNLVRAWIIKFPGLCAYPKSKFKIFLFTLKWKLKKLDILIFACIFLVKIIFFKRKIVIYVPKVENQAFL